jgi:hypothetical protein
MEHVVGCPRDRELEFISNWGDLLSDLERPMTSGVEFPCSVSQHQVLVLQPDLISN